MKRLVQHIGTKCPVVGMCGRGGTPKNKRCTQNSLSIIGVPFIILLPLGRERLFGRELRRKVFCSD